MDCCITADERPRGCACIGAWGWDWGCCCIGRWLGICWNMAWLLLSVVLEISQLVEGWPPLAKDGGCWGWPIDLRGCITLELGAAAAGGPAGGGWAEGGKGVPEAPEGLTAGAAVIWALSWDNAGWTAAAAAAAVTGGGATGGWAGPLVAEAAEAVGGAAGEGFALFCVALVDFNFSMGAWITTSGVRGRSRIRKLPRGHILAHFLEAADRQAH